MELIGIPKAVAQNYWHRNWADLVRCAESGEGDVRFVRTVTVRAVNGKNETITREEPICDQLGIPRLGLLREDHALRDTALMRRHGSDPRAFLFMQLW